ncbi:hypothetical protein [Sphingomonas sp. ERG5]|uniref:hypothetical protein n=1 Tax=Sphingomonas sp. ERG5 TaxID=1381597 RepID=UPI001364B69D|nr:hypothetical protein [Sphingomonas sp. ERG5]
MLGLILDYYWMSMTDPIVQVTVEGSLAELRAVGHVDPSQAVDGWNRADVIPLEEHDVTSDLTGGLLKAHICARKGTDFRHALRAAEQET